MADVKTLFRDTAREEYFYRMGFQEGYKTGKGYIEAPTNDALLKQLEATTGHAREQVTE